MKGELFTVLTANEEANLCGGGKIKIKDVTVVVNAAGSNNGSASINGGPGKFVGKGAAAIVPGDAGNVNSSTNNGSGSTGGVGIAIILGVPLG